MRDRRRMMFMAAVSWVTMAAALALMAPAAFAAEPPSPNTPTTSADSHSVIAYPASFFAPMGLETAYDMVQRLPGFVLDDGSAVRGFAGAAGNVLIDGQRPASKTDDLISNLQRIAISQVERIDLVRGGAPGLDMQGKTIVANVIRKKSSGLTGDAVYGQYKPEGVEIDPQLKLEGAWRDGERTLEGSLFLARYHDNTEGSGPHDIFGPNGQLLDISPMHNSAPAWQNTATAAYETPLLGGRFRLNFTLQDQPYDLFSQDNFHLAGLEIERVHQDITDGELGLHFSRDLPSSLSLEVFGLQHLNRTGYASTFDTLGDAQYFNVGETGGESIARAILHWHPSAALTVDAGGEFDYNWLKTHTLFTDDGTPVTLPAADVLVQEGRGEAFTTATWKATPTLAIEAGMRVEESTITSSGDVTLIKTLLYPKPRLVVTWSPDADDQVRVRIEREVGQLNFNYFAATATLNGPGVFPGNPNLAPQTDIAFEAAYDRHFWKDGVVSLTVRHLTLQNVIDQAAVSSPSGYLSEPANIGGGSENDLVASFSLPLDRVGIPGAAMRGLGTWRVSQVVDPTTGEQRPISGQHPLDAELHFSQDLPKWKLNWGVDLSIGYTQRNYYFDEVDTTRDANSTSVFLEYTPRPDIAVRFEEDDFNRGSYYFTRQVFDGPRNLDPLDFTDYQEHRFGLISYFRIRKTFG